MAIQDIQAAADMLRPMYERTKKRDGYVSFEVSPFLANDTAGHHQERAGCGKRSTAPNLMVKVPPPKKAFPPSSTLLSEGMNINVTLLFAQDMYEKVALAYIAGLEKFAASGGDRQHGRQRRQLFRQPHR